MTWEALFSANFAKTWKISNFQAIGAKQPKYHDIIVLATARRMSG